MGIKVKALSVYKSDDKLEEEGKWAPIAEGVEFKIRRARCKLVEEARERIYGPHERSLGRAKKKLPEKLEVTLTCQLMSQAVIADWRGEGMVDDNGAPIPFTPENCFEVVSDAETGKDLRSVILQYAMDGEFYDPTSEDATSDEGNSSITSNGQLSTAES